MSLNIMPERVGKPLPAFRKDLEVYEGPDDQDGSPTYNIFDPVQSKYFKVSWGEATILMTMKPGMTVFELVDLIKQTTTLQITPQEVAFFIEDAIRKNLVMIPKSSDELTEKKEKSKINPFKWIMYKYLYIRIPLINPDHFLAKTLFFVKPLLSKLALKLYALIVIMGLLILVTRFDDFIHTFTYFFNAQGLIAYAVGITGVKVIHEFAHAYTAKNFGIRVPSMGVAIIVLWPVLFTDVTDSWKLKRRAERLGISFAGIASEILLAGLCTFGWAISDPGIAQSLFFIIASATWISTLAINLNPAMRWDGYFLLCDLWGIDNLQPRAFEITRWKLRKFLWGLNLSAPEEFPRKTEIGLVIYTLYTWIYRLILYTGIATLVYIQFTKVLGFILFILEICVFIIGPFYSEAKKLVEMKKFFKINLRVVTTFTVLGLILGYLILPLPHTFSFPAISEPSNSQIVYTPFSGKLDKIYVKRDDIVTQGEPLVYIYSSDLQHQIDKKQKDVEILEKQIQLISYDKASTSYLTSKQEEMKTGIDQLNGLLAERDERTVRSALNGKIYEWNENLKEGDNISKGKELGRIANLKENKVIVFIPEWDINHIQQGSKAYFKFSNFSQKIPGIIKRIRPTHVVNLDYPQLASTNKGPIPVVNSEKTLKMVGTYYIAEMVLDPDQETHFAGDVGEVYYSGPWTSYLFNALRHIQAIIWQEGNF